jgi:hypothetical protein
MEDLGIVHMMLVLQTCRMQELLGHGGFYLDFKEKLRGQVMFSRLECLMASPERLMHEAIRVKLKMQWKPHDIGDARHMECLLRKAVGSKWSQPNRETMWAATSKAVGVDFPSL